MRLADPYNWFILALAVANFAIAAAYCYNGRVPASIPHFIVGGMIVGLVIGDEATRRIYKL